MVVLAVSFVHFSYTSIHTRTRVCVSASSLFRSEALQTLGRQRCYCRKERHARSTIDTSSSSHGTRLDDVIENQSCVPRFHGGVLHALWLVLPRSRCYCCSISTIILGLERASRLKYSYSSNYERGENVVLYNERVVLVVMPLGALVSLLPFLVVLALPEEDLRKKVDSAIGHCL